MTLQLAIALIAAQAAPGPQWHCEDPQAQIEMNACAALDFERADAELNAEYRAAIADARRTDRSPDNGRAPGDDRPGEEATLREAQRAWVVFRDATCRLEGYGERGGSIEPMVYDGCRARLTRERTAQLRPSAGEERQ
jgi:uncharacterized protein YecT (DUF1311 family)